MTRVTDFEALSKDQLLKLLYAQDLELQAHLETNSNFATEVDLIACALQSDMAHCLRSAKSDWAGINARIRWASVRHFKKIIGGEQAARTA